MIFGSSDVKSIIALDVEPSFNELGEEVEGSADEKAVVETQVKDAMHEKTRRVKPIFFSVACFKLPNSTSTFTFKC